MNDFLKIRKELRKIFYSSIKSLLSNIKFVWLFWLVNLMFGIILVIPFYYLSTINLNNSLQSYFVVSNYDYDWLFQMASLYQTNFMQYFYIIIPTAFLYLLVQLLLVGGIVMVLHNNNDNHHLDFFYGSIKYFIRFFKVFIISLILIILVIQLFILLNKSVTQLFEFQENKDFEQLLKIICLFFSFLLLIIINIISDYTKVSLAILNKYSVLKQFFWTVKFIYYNFSKIFITFLIVATLGLLFALIYNILDYYIPKTNIYYLVLIFVLQQILIVLRIILKLFFYSTQVELFKDLTAETIDFTK
jgi:hypothetical protein